MGANCLPVRVQVFTDLHFIFLRNAASRPLYDYHLRVDRCSFDAGRVHFNMPELSDRIRCALDDRISLAVLGQLCVQHAAVGLSHSNRMAAILACRH